MAGKLFLAVPCMGGGPVPGNVEGWKLASASYHDQHERGLRRNHRNDRSLGRDR